MDNNTTRPLQRLGTLSSIPLNGRCPTVPLSSRYLQGPMATPSGPYSTLPPPLPARQDAYSSRYNRFSGMGGMYSPYSRFSPSMYGGMYGGGYGMPYGSYGAQNGAPNSFIQMAEESTRPAFESIESVVEVVSSISMMLESTYHAVHSSYSAILGVVDQFARLKDHLAQILSILALLRGLRWLCLKVLYILKLRKENPSVEDAWNSAEIISGSSQSPVLPGEPQRSAWPFLMFVGLVIGAPWLMFKLLSKSVAKKPFDHNSFKNENGAFYVGTTVYDFTATRPEELSFRAGERLYVSPKSIHSNSRGWLFACNEKNETGLIPSNYLAAGKRAQSQAINQVQERLTNQPGQIPEQMTSSDNYPVASSSSSGIKDSDSLLSSNECVVDIANTMDNSGGDGKEE